MFGAVLMNTIFNSMSPVMSSPKLPPVAILMLFFFKTFRDVGLWNVFPKLLFPRSSGIPPSKQISGTKHSSHSCYCHIQEAEIIVSDSSFSHAPAWGIFLFLIQYVPWQDLAGYWRLHCPGFAQSPRKEGHLSPGSSKALLAREGSNKRVGEEERMRD